MPYAIDTFNIGEGHFVIQPSQDLSWFRLDFRRSQAEWVSLGQYDSREAARDAIVAQRTGYLDWDEMYASYT